jgi:hypothetical protein
VEIADNYGHKTRYIHIEMVDGFEHLSCMDPTQELDLYLDWRG